MPVWLSVATSAITALNRRLFMLVVWLMAIVVPVMLFEVVARYVFNAPTVWGMELAVMLFGPYFLLGGPYLLHLKGHVALDLVRQRLSPVWLRRLDLVNYPVIVLFCAILLLHSVPAAWSAWSYRETSFSAWNPPVWPIKATVPLALALMLLQALVEFVRTWFHEAPTATESA
ncbi:MAG: TRAP transporter small permease subunit [Hydrogenophaga sp.]|uniref:TRAP transporter small permease subunit n=1 Tax=Hydrogenophaga sp. TaxID=1904254 RepID=UPI001DCE8AA6|nr:TRAP transporter small permease subunit [Hydrogenophaga sp.]MBX3608737.1 TRAP transporter small permease subunit [Hydrogenophaga sp.]